MTRRIGVARLDRLDHQLEELFVRLFEFQVRAVDLPQTQDGHPERRGRDRAEVRVHPREGENQRRREKIEPDPENPRYLRTVRGAGYRFEVPK